MNDRVQRETNALEDKVAGDVSRNSQRMIDIFMQNAQKEVASLLGFLEDQESQSKQGSKETGKAAIAADVEFLIHHFAKII